jgi:hypothetical protein
MRVQINLRVSKYRCTFLDAVRGPALREFIRKILRVIICQARRTDRLSIGCDFQVLNQQHELIWPLLRGPRFQVLKMPPYTQDA